MSNTNEKKNSHLTIEDRTEIQECLNRGMTFKAIGRRIGKDQTTVSKEIKKHIKVDKEDCRRTNEKGEILPPSICPLLLKAPFVCNPCLKRRYCRMEKRVYFAKTAQEEYEDLLSECRTGIPLNKSQFYENDKIITQGIKNGQHLYHILQTNNLGVSKSTVYRHAKLGYLTFSRIDLPRAVKFKARRKSREDRIPTAIKIGRTYDDFLAYCEEHDIHNWIEMDTVLGRIGGKVLLTLDFTLCNFMVGILLENKSALEVTSKIAVLKKRLADASFSFADVFPLVLTDNGGEFANVSAIEKDLQGADESHLFFCDPYKSCQKPRVEKNHTLLRDILPKGTSFDLLTQEDINLIFSHINGVKRKSLNGKSSYEFFSFVFGTQLPRVLGITPIDAANVVQSPRLLSQLVTK